MARRQLITISLPRNVLDVLESLSARTMVPRTKIIEHALTFDWNHTARAVIAFQKNRQEIFEWKKEAENARREKRKAFIAPKWRMKNKEEKKKDLDTAMDNFLQGGEIIVPKNVDAEHVAVCDSCGGPGENHCGGCPCCVEAGAGGDS